MFAELVRFLIFGGFCFVAGIVFGLHRAKTQDIESKRKEKHTSN